jgi:hypothetical protein
MTDSPELQRRAHARRRYPDFDYSPSDSAEFAEFCRLSARKHLIFLTSQFETPL